jgi:4-alpha-glucanotransferase
VLRLDHVMGLYHLYWVPAGAEATDGVYVRYRSSELRAITSLEAQRSGTAIVGEDLGTVPDEVRQGMAQDRMLRSWVLQFEVSENAPLPDPPELSMATIGTHDLPRFVTFFEGPGRARWRRSLGGDARRALRTCLDHLAAGPARLVMADLEDLWLERWPHNRPGTGPEAGNWRHRSARTLEAVLADRAVADSLGRVDALRREEDIP